MDSFLSTIHCKTNHIPDKPNNDDLFGESHKNIADSITKLIISQEEGHTIGIQGNWGTGKSTVVNIIKKNFKDDTNTKIVDFDTWSHEGDPLKRVFLYRLLENLRLWIDDDKTYSNLENQITGLKGSLTEPANKQGNFPVFWIITAISILFVPVALQSFFTQLNNLTLSKSNSSGLNFEFLFSTAFIVFFLFMVFSSVIRIRKNPGFIKMDLFKLFSITNPETITSNPCSIDFEKCFKDIIEKSCINQREKSESIKMKDEIHQDRKKIIFIIDNIDRVDTDFAKQIINTLQSFIDPDNTKINIFKNIWVIIPYDLEALLKIWNKNGNPSESSQAFFAKRIQSIFRVPLLINSKWKKFIFDKMKEAFPQNHLDDEIYAVIKIYQQFLNSSNLEPNPRDIIGFINQIGAYHILWEDKITLDEYAEFITKFFLPNRNSITMNSDNYVLLEDMIKNEQISKDKINHFLSLYYVMEQKDAYEYHFSRIILKTIESEDFETINNFYRINPLGFWSVFDDFDFNNILKNNSLTSICFVSKIFNSIDHTDEWNKKISTKIKNKLLDIKDWSFLDSEKLDNLDYLFSKLSEVELQRLFASFAKIEFISSRINDDTNIGETRNGLLKTWLDSLITFVNKDNYSLRNGKYNLVVPFIEKGLFELLTLLCSYKEDNKIFECLCTNIEETTITNEIVDRISSNKFYEESKDLFQVLQKLNIAVDWEKILVAIQKQLLESEPAAINVKSLLLLLLTIRNQLEFSKEFVQTISSSNRLLLLAHANISNNSVLSGLLFCMITFGNNQVLASGAIPAGIDQSIRIIREILTNPKNHVEVLNEFSSFQESFSRMDQLFVQLSNNDNSTTFLLSILEILLTKNMENPIITDVQFFTNWKTIKKCLQVENYLSLLSKFKSIQSIIAQKGFSILDLELYNDLIDIYKPNIDTDFLEKIQDYYSVINTEQWLDFFENKNPIIDFLQRMTNEISPIKLNIPFTQAIEQNLLNFVSSEKIPEKIIENWDSIKQSFPDVPTLIVSLKKVFRVMLSLGKPMSESFYNWLGKELLVEEIISSDEKIIEFFEKIIKEENLPGIRWINDIFDKFPKILHNFSAKNEILAFKTFCFYMFENSTSDTIKSITSKIISSCRWKKPKTVS